MHYFVSFLVCNHLKEEKRAGCFAFLSYECLVTVYVLWLFLTVTWVGLQCVIVVFLIILTYFLFYLVAYFKKTHTYIHCIYMHFTPDRKHILKKLERYAVFYKTES